jgi:hypothetical protein
VRILTSKCLHSYVLCVIATQRNDRVAASECRLESRWIPQQDVGRHTARGLGGPKQWATLLNGEC